MSRLSKKKSTVRIQFSVSFIINGGNGLLEHFSRLNIVSTKLKPFYIQAFTEVNLIFSVKQLCSRVFKTLSNVHNETFYENS